MQLVSRRFWCWFPPFFQQDSARPELTGDVRFPMVQNRRQNPTLISEPEVYASM
jgi:hypothetical protein